MERLICNVNIERFWQNSVKRELPNYIFGAHVLNLVICDVTENKVEALSLFGLLNSCAVFIRE